MNISSPVFKHLRTEVALTPPDLTNLKLRI